MSDNLTALSKVPSDDLARRIGAIVRDTRMRYGKSLREGQLLMNALVAVDVELAHMVSKDFPEADCYYDDSKITAFMALLFPNGLS